MKKLTLLFAILLINNTIYSQTNLYPVINFQNTVITPLTKTDHSGFNSPGYDDWLDGAGCTTPPVSINNDIFNNVYSINTKLLRFPGGSISDSYHFDLNKKGYGNNTSTDNAFASNVIVYFADLVNNLNVGPVCLNQPCPTHAPVRVIYVANILQHFTNNQIVTPTSNSTLFNQMLNETIGAIQYLKSRNIIVDKIEYGNEFYLKDAANEPNYSPTDNTNRLKYIEIIQAYINNIKNIQGWTEIKHGVPFQIEAGIKCNQCNGQNTGNGTRWNCMMNCNKNIFDGFVLHKYYYAATQPNNIPVNDLVTYSNYINDFLSFTLPITNQPDKSFQKAFMKDVVASGKEAWFTEWNLNYAFDQTFSRSLQNTFLHSDYYLRQLLNFKYFDNVDIATSHAILSVSSNTNFSTIFSVRKNIQCYITSIETNSTYYVSQFINPLNIANYSKLTFNYNGTNFNYTNLSNTNSSNFLLVPFYNSTTNNNKIVKLYFSNKTNNNIILKNNSFIWFSNYTPIRWNLEKQVANAGLSSSINNITNYNLSGLVSDSIIINKHSLGVITFYNYSSGGTSSKISSNNELIIEKNISIYPNPSNDFITLKNNSEDYVIRKIQIQNISGQIIEIIENININKFEEKIIDINNLSPGLYNFILNDGNGFESVKFIKN